MKVTVVVPDSIVIVDGTPYKCDFVAPVGLHAVQFEGGSGEAEWYDSANEVVDTDFIAPFVDAWSKARDTAVAAQEAEAARWAEFNNRYDVKRVAEYPPITDYIDGVVKGDQAQVQAYIDACLAIKVKYPKPE